MVGINTSKIVDTKLTFDASKIAKIYNALYDIAYESQPSVEEVLKKILNHAAFQSHCLHDQVF